MMRTATKSPTLARRFPTNQDATSAAAWPERSTPDTCCPGVAPFRAGTASRRRPETTRLRLACTSPAVPWSCGFAVPRVVVSLSQAAGSNANSGSASVSATCLDTEKLKSSWDLADALAESNHCWSQDRDSRGCLAEDYSARGPSAGQTHCGPKEPGALL